MEAVGLKIARIPKQFIRTPVIASALGKGIKPNINGIKQYGVVVGNTISNQMQQSPSINSFSSIR